MATNSVACLRQEKGWTQAQMAERLSVSESYLGKIETGERKPSREFLAKIKDTFPTCDMNIFFT